MVPYLIREALLLSAIAWALWEWRRLPKPRTILFTLIGTMAFLALAVEVTGMATTLSRMNNSVVYNVFTLVEFLLQLGLVLAYWPALRILVIIAAIIGISAWSWSLSFRDPLEFLLIEGLIAFAVLLMSLSLLTIWRMARASARALHWVPEFWVFSGVLLYNGSLLPVLTTIHYVFVNDDVVASWLWYIPPMLCILRYACAAKACRLKSAQFTST